MHAQGELLRVLPAGPKRIPCEFCAPGARDQGYDGRIPMLQVAYTELADGRVPLPEGEMGKFQQL